MTVYLCILRMIEAKAIKIKSITSLNDSLFFIGMFSIHLNLSLIYARIT
jgi:hypothetical protein